MVDVAYVAFGTEDPDPSVTLNSRTYRAVNLGSAVRRLTLTKLFVYQHTE